MDMDNRVKTDCGSAGRRVRARPVRKWGKIVTTVIERQ